MSSSEESGLYKLYLESLVNENILMIATTVDTGFEWQAIDECREKLHIKNVQIVKERGKIYFNITRDQFPNVQNMRSIDNILIVGNVHKFDFNKTDKEKDLQLLKDAVHQHMKLEKALNAWKDVTGFLGKIYPTKDEFEAAHNNHKNSEDKSETDSEVVDNRGRKRGQDPCTANKDDVVKFRATCERTGTHTFESSDVARTVGGELQDKYLWIVDLVKYHLEIVCKVVKDQMVTALRVTHLSKHRRNICNFGPTTLRATICYNLLRLANPKPGDIIIDPMCGGGSIPIEAALAYRQSYALCGDNHSKAVTRAKSNIDVTIPQEKIDLLQWSVSKLPLQDSSVDIIVSDMPFGKRSGRMIDNRVLYKELLLELGRVVRHSVGRLVLLTYDKRSFNMALQAAGNLFRVTKMLGVNIGGLQAAVYVLRRSDILYKEFQPKQTGTHRHVRNNESIKNTLPI